MSEHNPNDPLESFLRKSLHDLNETPPDVVWDGILMRLPKVDAKKTFPFRNSGFILIGFLLLSLLAYQEFSSKQEIMALHRQVDQLIIESKNQRHNSVEDNNSTSTPPALGRDSSSPATRGDDGLATGRDDAESARNEGVHNSVSSAIPRPTLKGNPSLITQNYEHPPLNNVTTAAVGSSKNKNEVNNNTHTNKTISHSANSVETTVRKKETPDVVDRQTEVAASLHKLEEAIAELKTLNYQPLLVEKMAALLSDPNELPVGAASTSATEISLMDNGQLTQQIEKEELSAAIILNTADNTVSENLASPSENEAKQPTDFSTMTLVSLAIDQLTDQKLPVINQELELVWPEIAEAQIPKLPKGKWTVQGYGLLAKDRGSIKNLDDDNGMSKHGDIGERTTRGNSYGYGLRGQYHFSRKWAVISGLEYQDNRYHHQHHAELKHKDREGGSGGNTEVDPPPPPETEFTFHYELNTFLGTSEITFDTALKEDVIDEIDEDEKIEADVTITRRQQIIAVPLLLERNWKNKNPFYFSVKAGLMTKWLVSDEQRISAFDFENENMLLRGSSRVENENGKKGSSPSKISYDYVLAAGLHCDLSRRFGIMLEPRMTGLLGPKIKNDDIFINHFTLGLNALLYYRF